MQRQRDRHNQRYKQYTAENKKKNKDVKPDRLGEAVQTVKEYNRGHDTHLTYGQYMLKKREGEIT